uniref:Knottins-like domain-containing protein n=1 Tax=Oryza brachyantha TaxID=4533 RepID=J3LA06_ORYBR
MKTKFAVTTLVLLLLTFGNGESKMCKEHSKTFKGLCLNNNNCISRCITEDYTGGYCSGTLDRKCVCMKECDDALPPQPLPPKSGRHGHHHGRQRHRYED